MEKVKVNSLEESYTCHTCLSADRKLYPLGEFADVYFKICSHACRLSLAKTVICWECAEIMKKFKLFQKKAEYAQNVISLFQTKKNVLLKSLSSLHNTNISTENIINMVFADETENKYLIPIPHIKEELNTDVDNNGVDYRDDLNHDLSDVKEEITELIKNENCDINAKKNYYVKRPKQYRYVCDKISKNDLAKLTRKVPIGLCEIKDWLEREKEIEVYKNSEFKCESCVYSWRNEKGLLEHRKKYHNDLSGTYTCDICTSRFPNKRSLSAHLSRHSRVLECAACRMRMCAPRHMARHLAAHTRKLQCVTCGALNFSNIRQLYKHNRALHRIFICDHCGKKCKWRRTMEKHMRSHFETYECKICVRRYKNRASYRKHYDTKHRIATTEDAYCAPCGKQFNNVSLYRRHLGSSAAHASERDAHRSKNKVACPECGREYSRKAYMMNHYKHVHLNQSNFYCQQCDRYFLNRTRYIDHMRYKHEGIQKEKNKLCNICGRGFAANRTLIHHIRTHSGERPFECEFCSGKFSQKHAMLSHVKHVHLKSKRRVRWQQEVS